MQKAAQIAGAACVPGQFNPQKVPEILEKCIWPVCGGAKQQAQVSFLRFLACFQTNNHE